MKFLCAVMTKLVFATSFLSCLTLSPVCGEQWTVPVAGNAFPSNGPTNEARREIRFSRSGELRLVDPAESYSVFFHVDRPGKVALSIKASKVSGSPVIAVTADGKSMKSEVGDSQSAILRVGEIDIAKSGYVQVDLQLDVASGSANASVSDLIVTSDVEGMSVEFVRNNDGNMFYWGRRGPSVHLGYKLPDAVKLTYAYSEITVPEGQDPIGSYFMANGFGEGYFGIQVNSKTERRVLFSVWSPFKTDNPADIPNEQRIVTLAKGDSVHAQDFGNEGSGGQSYLVFPWKSGTIYRFLTEVKPDGAGNTIYTSWFGEARREEWRLIASFRRPDTNKHLTGFHSFLENFSPATGNQQRSALYGNQWVCDVDGKWHEVTRAKFTGDNTARGRHRLDYAGGSDDDHFFLRNCGFFSDRANLDEVFQRDAAEGRHPKVRFSELPR
ncbi:DUF3472 domain-containing protein [Rubripirellula reticaptiva]|uniref:DUF5077 domain-containing protein n=1 Tax=Rubripirellula reticaptiva TaxID=2528013 RepID=A0A5C6EWF8_9BACT|nr:DUF3472 domain-containing protein [Rubripirellula reticaptiva]TWU51809.1 hypothetical protein Poly59_34040 [Rubripirellula reticaptiva]